MKLIKFLFIFLVMGTKFTYAYDPSDFDRWKLKFKILALKNNGTIGVLKTVSE